MSTSSASTTPAASDDDIPLPIKIILPTVVVVLAIIITSLVCRRHPGVTRACRRKKKETVTDVEMQTVLPLYTHNVRENASATRQLPQTPSAMNHVNSNPRQQSHVPVGTVNGHPPGHESRHVASSRTPQLLDCEQTVENQLYAHSVAYQAQRPRCHTGEPHAEVPGEQDRNNRPPTAADGRCGAFVPGSKGYITMSSPNTTPLNKCRPRTGYITARPEFRQKPVNICPPMAREEDPLADDKDHDTQRFLNNDLNQPHKTDDSVYEKLDQYYKHRTRTKRTESLPSSKFRQKRYQKSYSGNHYDSLPMLPVEMSLVEIPIGPFITMDKREEGLSETVEKLQKRDSFENMFEGAWWHGGSEEDLLAAERVPGLPHKQLRNKTSSLPFVFRQSDHRPLSAPYVTMNKGTRHGFQRDRVGTCIATLPGQRSGDSYMTHGQMMKLLHICGVSDDTADATPPPQPCVVRHDYVNAKSVPCNTAVESA